MYSTYMFKFYCINLKLIFVISDLDEVMIVLDSTADSDIMEVKQDEDQESPDSPGLAVRLRHTHDSKYVV